jgi:hypothetical protein
MYSSGSNTIRLRTLKAASRNVHVQDVKKYRRLDAYSVKVLDSGEGTEANNFSLSGSGSGRSLFAVRVRAACRDLRRSRRPRQLRPSGPSQPDSLA